MGKKSSFISLYEQAGSVFSNSKGMKRPISMKAGQILDSFGWKGFGDSSSSYLYIYNEDYAIRLTIEIKTISGDIQAEELFSLDGEAMFRLYGTKGEIEIKSVHDNDGYECYGFYDGLTTYNNPMRLVVNCSVSDTYSFEEGSYPADLHMTVTEPDDEISALVCNTTVMIGYNDGGSDYDPIAPNDTVTVENRDIAFICTVNPYPNRGTRSGGEEPDMGPYMFDGWYDAATGKLVSTSPVYIVNHPTHSIALKPKARLAKMCTVKLTSGENIQGVRAYETKSDSELPDFSRNFTGEFVEGTNITIEAKYGRDYSFGKWLTTDGKTYSITETNELVVNNNFQLGASAIDMEGKCIVRVNTSNNIVGFPWLQTYEYINGKFTLEDDGLDHKEFGDNEKTKGSNTQLLTNNDADGSKVTYTALKKDTNEIGRSVSDSPNTLGKFLTKSTTETIDERFGIKKKSPEEIVNALIEKCNKEKKNAQSDTNENETPVTRGGDSPVKSTIKVRPYVEMCPVVEAMGSIKYIDGNRSSEGTMHSYTYNRNNERTIKLVATPNKGCKFIGWYYSEHHTIISIDPTLEFKVTSRGKRKHLTAIFVKDDPDFLMLKAKTNDPENTTVLIYPYVQSEEENPIVYSSQDGNVAISWDYDAFYRYYGDYPMVYFVSRSRLPEEGEDRFIFKGWKGVEGNPNWYEMSDGVTGLYFASKYDIEATAEWENIGSKKIVESRVYIMNYHSSDSADYAATVTGTGCYNVGEEVTITVTPTSGYKFLSMYLESYDEETYTEIYDGCDNTFTFTVTDDVYVYVTVGYEDTSYLIGEHTKGGYTQFYGSLDNSASVTAYPDEGYTFLRWEYPVDITPYIDNIETNRDSSYYFEWYNNTGVWTGDDVHIRAIFGPEDGEYVGVYCESVEERHYPYGVAGVGLYEIGDEVTLSSYVDAKAGDEFVAYIYDDGYNMPSITSMNNPFTFTIPPTSGSPISVLPGGMIKDGDDNDTYGVANKLGFSVLITTTNSAPYLVVAPNDGVYYTFNQRMMPSLIYGMDMLDFDDYELTAIVEPYHDFEGWEYSEEWAHFIRVTNNVITLAIREDSPSVNLIGKALVSPKTMDVVVEKGAAQSMGFTVNSGSSEVEYGTQTTVSISPAVTNQGEFIAWQNETSLETSGSLLDGTGVGEKKGGNEEELKDKTQGIRDCSFNTTYTFTVFGNTSVSPCINGINSGKIMYTLESKYPLAKVTPDAMFYSSMSGNCFGQINPSGLTTFTAHPEVKDKNTGKTYSFKSWTVTSAMPVDYTTKTNSVAISSANATVRIKANYEEQTGDMVRLIVNVAPSGSGDVSCSYDGYKGEYVSQIDTYVERNTPVVLCASPNEGYEFYRWEDEGGRDLGNHTTIDYTVKEDTVIYAAFNEQPKQATLTVDCNPPEGGIVYINEVASSSTTVAQGTTVTLLAKSNDGFNFQEWVLGGEHFSSENTIYYTVDKTTTITASFSQADK